MVGFYEYAMKATPTRESKRSPAILEGAINNTVLVKYKSCIKIMQCKEHLRRNLKEVLKLHQWHQHVLQAYEDQANSYFVVKPSNSDSGPLVNFPSIAYDGNNDNFECPR